MRSGRSYSSISQARSRLSPQYALRYRTYNDIDEEARAHMDREVAVQRPDARTVGLPFEYYI